MTFDENGRIINLGVIGLGRRGFWWTQRLLEMRDVRISAVCDVYEDRVSHAADEAEKTQGSKPFTTANYQELIARADVEAVLIFSNWETHARVAAECLRAGKRAAIEVGGASSVEECWELVRLSELHKTPLMFLENCCYGQDELTVFTMERQGLFGEVVHCAGAYHHDLRDAIGWSDVNRHYRRNHFFYRNAELYPSHALGPISKLLRINRGNRILSLSSMASKSAGMREWYAKNRPDHPLAERAFALGDIVTTMIKCAGGETITLTHDNTLPRPYSRGGKVQGTKGIWMEDNHSYYLEGVHPNDQWANFNEAIEKYPHPLWQAYQNSDKRDMDGHGGMDYLVMRAFIESVQQGTNPPIDVYDAAVWMAVTCLSEDSIALGGMPVPVPDFTNGCWYARQDEVCGQYAIM